MNDNEVYGMVAIVGLVVFGGCFLAWLYYRNRTAVPATVTLEELKKWGVIFERK